MLHVQDQEMGPAEPAVAEAAGPPDPLDSPRPTRGRGRSGRTGRGRGRGRGRARSYVSASDEKVCGALGMARMHAFVIGSHRSSDENVCWGLGAVQMHGVVIVSHQISTKLMARNLRVPEAGSSQEVLLSL